MLTRTNAQLAKVQAAMDAARVPSLIAGADLGPASDLRAESGRRGARPDDDEDAAPRGPGRPRPRGAHHVPPRQGPAVADRASSSGSATGLMPIASAQTPAAVDEERRLLYVALTRSEEELWCSWFERSGDEAAAGSSDGTRAQPVAGADRADHRRAREGGGADGGDGGLAHGWPSCARRLAEGADADRRRRASKAR